MNGLDISEIMSKISENPELLKTALGAAMGLAGLSRENEQQNDGANTDEQITKPENSDKDKGKDTDLQKKTELIRALMPFLNNERREKAELLLRVLKLVDLNEISSLLNHER